MTPSVRTEAQAWEGAAPAPARKEARQVPASIVFDGRVERGGRHETVEPAAMFLHLVPALDGKIEHCEAGGREFCTHSGKGIAVAEAGEQGREVGHAGRVANDHERSHLRRRAADDG